MARRGVTLGAIVVVFGVVALLGDAVLGCVQHTSYCATWSLLGILGPLLFLVGLAIAALSYRRGRPSVVDWSDHIAAESAGDGIDACGASNDPSQHGP